MIKSWIEAFRLRTLPLALSCIGMGSALAYDEGQFKLEVFVWACVTTVFLQILSNLANDFGDTQNGADNIHRKGPSRATQKGAISIGAMKIAMAVFSLLSLGAGIVLLKIVFGNELLSFIFFLALGVLSIIAAIKYTAGDKPYGYAGLGDVAVFVFFGLVGVMGVYYLYSYTFELVKILPAITIGALSVGVLNVNNMRDIESDLLAGKYSIPVRLGLKQAKVYHAILLIVGMGTLVVYVLMGYNKLSDLLFIIVYPFIVKNIIGVWKETESEKIDPYLKQLALSTFAVTILYFISVLI